MPSVYTFNTQPVKNAIFTFLLMGLTSQADTDVFQTSVTLATGDVKVIGGTGTATNITTLPSEIGTTGVLIITLSASEMNHDQVGVLFHDAAGSQWQDCGIWFSTVSAITVSDFSGTLVTIADAVWDEILTGSTHNIASSAGRRLRQIAANIITDGTVISSTNNTVTLDAGASAISGSYDPSIITVVDPVTGMAQARMILDYVGASKTATIDRNWRINPDNTYTYTIVAHPGREHVNEGKPQAVAAGTITLNANASSIDNAYNGQLIFMRSGTGEDQVKIITAYNGTTKVATLDENWDTMPDTSSGYVIIPSQFGHVTTSHFNGTALQQMFTDDTGLTYSNAVDGSVIKEVLDGVPPSSVGAAAIWAYASRTLTMTLAQIINALTGTKLSIYRGDTNEINVVVGDISDYQQLDIFVKNDLEDRDDQAVFWIRKNLSGTADGLKALYDFEQAGGTIVPAWASIVINNAATGDITFTLKADASRHLEPDTQLWYDIQKITATKVKTLSKGTAEVEADVGKAIT